MARLAQCSAPDGGRAGEVVAGAAAALYARHTGGTGDRRHESVGGSSGTERIRKKAVEVNMTAR